MLRRLVVLSTLVAVSALAGPEPTQPAAAPLPRSNALSVRLSMGSPSFSPLVGLGGLTGFVLPDAGFTYERSFGHLSLVLSVDGSGNATRTNQSGSATFEPGVRWTFGDERLTGPWVGAHVPLSYSLSTSSFATEPAPTTFRTSSLGVGADVLAGWTFRFGEAFIAQAAVGPRVRMARGESMGNGLAASDSSVSLGLRGFVSMGAVF